EGLELDLPDALSRQAEPPADLLERLRLGAREPVPHHHDLPLALRQSCERVAESFAPEVELDSFLRKRLVAGHEVTEDGVLTVADRGVETRGGACSRADFE